MGLRVQLARDADEGRVAVEHRHLDLAGVDALLDQHLHVVLEGIASAAARSAQFLTFWMPTLEPMLQGLTKTGSVRVAAMSSRRRRRGPGAAGEGAVGRDRDAGEAGQPLGDVLVHADRRGHHAGADIGVRSAPAGPGASHPRRAARAGPGRPRRSRARAARRRGRRRRPSIGALRQPHLGALRRDRQGLVPGLGDRRRSWRCQRRPCRC